MSVENSIEWKKDEPSFARDAITRKTGNLNLAWCTRLDLTSNSFFIDGSLHNSCCSNNYPRSSSCWSEYQGANSRSFRSRFSAVQDSRECQGRAGSVVRLLQGAAPRAGWKKTGPASLPRALLLLTAGTGALAGETSQNVADFVLVSKINKIKWVIH